MSAKVIEREKEESKENPSDKESTPKTRPSTNEIEDALEMLQDLSMFSTRRDKNHFLLLNIESLLVHESIDNLKKSVVTEILKRIYKKKKAP